VAEANGAAMARAAGRAGTPLVPAAAGESMLIGGARVDVLWPPRRDGPPPAGEDPNQRAIVLLVQGGGVRLLLTADAESDVLAPLDLPPVDVLKVSHHGSADPGLPALLQRLRPRLAVIEVGRGNTYGHPTARTLGDLARAGALVRRTDRDGTVVVDAAGGRLRVHTHS
jgi:competence protein ComEC